MTNDVLDAGQWGHESRNVDQVNKWPREFSVQMISDSIDTKAGAAIV
jgi:hypothetical protein